MKIRSFPLDRPGLPASESDLFAAAIVASSVAQPQCRACPGADFAGCDQAVAAVPAARQPNPAAPPAPPASARPRHRPRQPNAKLPVPSTIGEDYKIAPNDLLEVEVFGVKELKREVRVNSSGYIALPLIGQIQVGGYTASDAEALVAIKYGEKYLQDPQISIFIKEFTTQRITVDGAVIKPGIFPLTGQITLLRALALAGGGSQLADLEEVMLFRLTPEGQNLVEKYDVLKIRKGEGKDPLLQGDDVIVVNRDSARTALRDSLFRDILDALNPFSQSVGNVAR